MNGVWPQPYTVFGLGLGWSAMVAAVPTLVLLYLLAVRRRPSWIAALAGLAATLVLAIGAYRMPVGLAVSSAGLGACFGVFPISWIVFWALVLFEITVATGRFEVIKGSIGALTSDRRMQALLIAFCFGAFLEGCAGFGTPVAVAAAMMAGLGFAPLYAAQICLLANTAPVAFGSIGIPIITLAAITGLPLQALSAMVGRLTAPVSFLLPAYLILVTSGWSAALEVWPALLLCGGVFASLQFLVSNFIGPQLTDILSSVGAIVALVTLLRFWRPQQRAASSAVVEPAAKRYGGAELWQAWLPYALLVLFVLAWGYAPIAAQLNRASIALQWPGLHNHVLRMAPIVPGPAKYAAIYNLNWLSASGTSCMGASLLAALLSGLSLREFGRILLLVARKLVKPTITVAAMLAMAFTMNYSGATGTLGISFAASGKAFPFFSALMGWLGVFLTGSDTASNALFGSLQVVSATRLGLDPVLIAGANSVGGVMGKMISLQTIAVAAAATGMSVADQASLFRFTLRHSLFLAAVVGIEVLIWAHAGGLH
ncbi:MAG: lactate permease LctP family transporter [Acidobacteriaceae bacterium]